MERALMVERPLHGRDGFPAGHDAAAAARARDALARAQSLELAGQLPAAADAYVAAAAGAAAAPDHPLHAEVLRHLGRVRFMLRDPERGAELLQQSYDIADAIGDDRLAAEALNAIGAAEMHQGRIEDARAAFVAAADRGARGTLPVPVAAGIRGHVEQNLGIIANIEGDLVGARAHYLAALDAFQRAENERGTARALHNLGMVASDLQRWDEADEHFRRSREAAERLGDVHLRGLCYLNHADVYLGQGAPEPARDSAAQSLRLFQQLGLRDLKAAALTALGVAHREAGRDGLAESRLQAAVAMAADAGAVLVEAEAARELAILRQRQRRNVDALRFLLAAHRLFARLGARVDLGDVAAKSAALQQTYLAVVRDWGQSIESKDSYTHGHCERVAAYAVATGAALGLDDAMLTTIRVGAYLHDVGKVRIPHAVLNKPDRLTSEELALVQRHPMFGVELLADVEFPWDITPAIRWHHEKFDGSGYPDRLRGDEIPIEAQIICAADVYDALTTTRSYRTAMTHEQALAEMHDTRRFWRPDVFDAFLRALERGPIAGLCAADDLFGDILHPSQA